MKEENVGSRPGVIMSVLQEVCFAQELCPGMNGEKKGEWSGERLLVETGFDLLNQIIHLNKLFVQFLS